MKLAKDVEQLRDEVSKLAGKNCTGVYQSHDRDCNKCNGFIAGFTLANDRAEALVALFEQIKEEHPDCTCEQYDSEAWVVCATCTANEALAKFKGEKEE